MAIFDQISEDIKKAMLAKDKVALDALRGLKKEFLEAKTAKGGDGELHDDQALKIIQKLVKQRKESAEMFTSAGRQELADEELAQMAVLEKYMPKQLTPEELEERLRAIIAEVGATSQKEMGKVMGAASKALAGLADGRMINQKVRELLPA